MKKFGLICLALVLALGALGIGYAAWTDTVTIDGSVATGDVDVNVVEVSSTFVYKILTATGGTPGEMVVHHVWGSTDPSPPEGTVDVDYILVASAVAVITAEDEVDVTMTNLFPSADFKVDFLLHYDGSIPARIKMGSPGSEDDIVFTGTDAAWFNALWPTVYGHPNYNNYPNDPEVAFYGEMWTSDVDGNKLVNIGDLEGYQLHECNYILLVITLHLPQDTPMNASADFTAVIDVIQWNEY